MFFCTECGQQLTEGAKFCSGCGKAITQSATTNNEKRKSVFEGEIHKCPHCDTILKSFTAVCPYCKSELRDTKNSNAIIEFTKKLEFAKSNQQKIDIIKSFPIPNNKEDIYEFMFLASSNFNVDYYVNHLNEEDVSDAWLAKIEQCYQKASLELSTKDLLQIETLYKEIKSNTAQALSKKRTKTIISSGFITVAIILLFIPPTCVVGFVMLIIALVNKKKKTIK